MPRFLLTRFARRPRRAKDDELHVAWRFLAFRSLNKQHVWHALHKVLLLIELSLSADETANVFLKRASMFLPINPPATASPTLELSSSHEDGPAHIQKASEKHKRNDLLYEGSVFLLGCYVLEKSADAFLDTISIVASRLRISETLIALFTAGAEWEEVSASFRLREAVN